jgi:uncharacterized protein YndB with AHSA1/START domain
MPSAKRSITISRPMADVFAYVADGENGREWRSAKIEVKHESGEGVGATYHQTVPGPMGRRIRADYEITDYDAPNRLAFRAIAGPVRPTGEYRLAKAGEGTKVTFSLDAKLPFLKRLLMGRSVQKSMDSEMSSLDKLKKVLEKRPVGGAAASKASAPAASAKPATKPAVKAAAKPAANGAAKPAGRAPAARRSSSTGPKPTSRRTPKK